MAAGAGAPAAGALPWLFVLVVLVAFGAVGAGAFALGSWRERERGRQALQSCKTEATAWRLLHRGVTWRADARHAIAAWQSPAGNTTPPPEHSALAAALAGERPLRDLRLPVDAPAEAGDGAWRLDAEPLRDALGVLVGHLGTARPIAEGDDAALAREALAHVLGAWPGVALLAAGASGAWRVVQGNDAARAHWPGLGRGTAVETLLTALPAQERTALAARLGSGGGHGTAADAANAADAAAGWQATRFALGTDREGLLLSRVAAIAAAPDDVLGSTLSHDLRAPIRVVEGFTRIVKEDYGPGLDRVANDHLDRVLGAAARMNLMIDALLTLTRLSAQPLARQPVNLSQLAGFIVEDLERSAPEREVDFEIEPGLVVQGDPTLLRLVLENLLGNAWKYSARTPRARISLRRVEHEGRPCYQVADNGAGFDMRSADRLFGLFQRLHGQGEFAGHGVGLASVQRIVQRHGGRIWAQGEPGRGATFSFTLP